MIFFLPPAGGDFFSLPPAGGNFLMVFINRKISNFVKNDASLVPTIGVKRVNPFQDCEFADS